MSDHTAAFRLVLETGEPAEPPVFVSTRQAWRVGDVFMALTGISYRIMRVLTPDGPGREPVWTVERI